MLKIKHQNKAAALFITLFMIMVVVILSNIILSIMLNHSRLTRHRVSRIQAYYAALAGINYALDRLRVGTDPLFPAAGTYTRNICNTNACGVVAAPPGGCQINEATLPCTVNWVRITIGAPGSGPGGTRTVAAQADYLYTP